MRTGRSLTVCRSLLPGGVGYVCSRWGVSAPGGVYSGSVCSGGCLLLRVGGVSTPRGWGWGVYSRGVSALGCVSALRGLVSALGGCLLWGVSALGGVYSGGVFSRGCLLPGVGLGCLLPGVSACLLWGRRWVSAPGGCLLPGVSALGGGVSAPRGVWWYPSMHWGPPVYRITDVCKNITLAQLRCGR